MTEINGHFQHMGTTQERHDKCPEHKFKYIDMFGREFWMCVNCKYTEKVE